jgi:pyruvate,water dikinase
MKNRTSSVLSFQDVDRTMLTMVGGKAANLGELLKIESVQVPPGFCVTTEVFKEVTGNNKEFLALMHQLSLLKADNREKISNTGAKIRKLIEELTIPGQVVDEITRHLKQTGEDISYAVRSSATAEDLPTASFAGQQDTYLNITGIKSILAHISKCWASLFTDRAIVYRLQNGYDHSKVYLSVVIQKMIFADVAGIMFTADPATSNRKLLSIDASFGLGEALVCGIVNGDSYKVQNGKIISKKISIKKLGVYASEEGGTNEKELGTDQQDAESLTDQQILKLERLGRKIEAHFGAPQDIEWCLFDDRFYIVQARPITTLYPVPGADDQENHVYLSVGHQQMMTDAMKPLGLSCWLIMTPPKTRSAGGRLFVDVAPMLASAEGRKTIIDFLGKYDPLIKDALTTITERGDFIKPLPSVPDTAPEGSSPAGKGSPTAETESKKLPAADKNNPAPPMPNYHALNEYNPTIVNELISSSKSSLEATKQKIKNKSGLELFDFILKDMEELKKSTTNPDVFAVIMTGMNAATWINEKMNEWLGEKNAADTISQSVPDNVTSEMGLALLDVADVIRPYPEVIDFLKHVKDDTFLDELVKYDGGQETLDAVNAFLKKYGMRCAGEIDITKTRWSEKPSTLVPLILSNIKNFEPNAGRRKFEQGLQEALKKEQELLYRLKKLPDGEEKAKETKRMIDLVRNYAGYREFPKYNIVCRYFVYKQALLKEAEKLVEANLIKDKHDIYYLSFEELHDVVRMNKLDYELITSRKEEHKLYEKLTPPRVITSDGEIITGKYRRENIPEDAMIGLAVSSGIIEGRARVILKMEDADLEEGDILVTSFTDPSWTPLFVSVKGLVTEVGALMSHGAVIAREYGLPAVVGVENATKLVKDGQQIRVNGTDGYIELL